MSGMADRITKEKRSWNMSRIRSKNTKPEMIVRSHLHKAGFRFRLHVKKLPGSPDVVIHNYNTVIQVQGCFWHGHEGCKDFVVPKTRTEWWLNKIRRNKENDRIKKTALKKLGWHVQEIWECQLKGKKKEKTLDRLVHKLGK